MPAEPFQNRGASKKGQRGRTPCFWSGSVGLPFKRQSLPSSGNVASIVGMSTALKNNCNKLKENTRHILMLEEVLLRKLKESDLDFICNTNVNHIPGNISLSFKGISGETLMHRLDLKGIMVSTGSACDSAKNQTSHVIKALGVPEDYAYGTIRISLGKENTEDEIEEIFIAINEIVKSLTV